MKAAFHSPISFSAILLALLLASSAFATPAGKTVSAARFGAKPDDGKDDTKALHKAARYCRQHPGTTLLISAGVYQITDPQARQLEEDVLAGKLGIDPEKKMFTPYFPYVKGLDFEGCKDVTVKAQGATLACDGWMEPVSITGATGFTLEGLTIDYKRQPHSEGRITDIEDGWFTVQFDDDRQMTRKMPMCRLCVWDARHGLVSPKVFGFPKREELPGNRLRIKGQMPPELLGQTVGVSHTFHFRPAIFIGHSVQTTIKDVTIHSQPGMGILGFDSQDITLEGVKVVPREGKRFSTNTDASHFAACRGLVKIEGCTFQGQGDDGINVHGYYHDIIECQEDGWLLTELKAPTYTHSQETDVPRIGDTVEITRIATLKPELTTVVTGVEWEPRSLKVRVRLQDPLPEPVDEYYLFNASKIPDLEFRSNRVLGNFARGVLSKARHATIEDNYFQGCSGTAIHVGAESGWKEGSFASRAVIRRNRIVNCGQSQGTQGGACGIAVLIDAPDTRESFIHGDVKIEDNDISSDLYDSECGIAAFNIDRLTLSGNRVSGSKDPVHTHAVRKMEGASRGQTQYRNSLSIWDIDRQFAQPDPRYRPYVRWWWNGDRVNPEELIRELHVMKEAGIGGVEISPIAFPSGADTLDCPALTWLSDEWIACLQTVFDETQQLGMGCDLLVGSGWPFGSESLKPEERASVLIAVAKPLSGGRRHTLQAGDLFAEGKPAVTIDNPDMSAEIVSLLLVPDPISDLSQAIDVRDRLHDGVLSLNVPRGKYQLHALIRYDSFASVINGAPGAAGSQIDYMNAEAIRAYLDRMADGIEAKTGPLSEHLRAFFVDNMELEGCNWTSDFAEEFRRRRSYDIMPWFPFIIFKMGRLGDVSTYSFGGAKSPEFQEQVDRARYDFEITRMELNYERYTHTFLAWCREKGVLSRAQAYGRGFWPLDSSLDYDIPEGESWTTNWLRHRIGEEMGDEDYRRGRAYTMVNKYVSSAAHIAGKRTVSAEEMTNTYLVFRMPLEFLKVGSDMAAFSGITHSVWHGFNYSPLEAPFPGWVQYGTFHNERNTWWPYVRQLNDYRARMSAVLQNVDLVAPIAILPANGDLWSELGAQNEPFPARLNTQWTSILWEAIHKNGGGADYVSEGVLRDASVLDGRLVCRTQAYEVLFLAGLKGIDEATLDKVDAFVRGGGRVFCIGGYPCKSLGLKDFAARDEAVRTKVAALARDFPEHFVALEMPEGGKGWLEWYAEVMRRYDLPHDVTVTQPDRFLLQNHYRGDDGTDWFLLANASFSEAQETDLVFAPTVCRKGGLSAGLLAGPMTEKDRRQALLYNPCDGQRYALEMAGDTLHLHLGPSETVLIAFRDRAVKAPLWAPAPLPPGATATHDASSAASTEAFTASYAARALQTPWQVTLVNPQVDSVIRFEAVPDGGGMLPDLKDTHPSFMGTATYRTTVTIPDRQSRLLHLGKVCDIAEVWVNGCYAGLRWWGDPVFDLSGLIRPGENELEIRVTTQMCNYMRTLPDNSAAKRFTFRRNHEPVSAGLIGPVTLY